MGKSIAEQVAELSEEEREAILMDFDMENLKWDWSFWGRPEQIMPNNHDWDIALFLAGRGAGKTRSAAEWIREKAKDTSQGPLRFLLVARTAADVREVIVEGESGILAVTPDGERPEYKPSIRRIIWPNGNQAFCTSADEPDSLRGVQAHYAWGDEIAAWRQTANDSGLTAWDNLRFATRLGTHPQIMATTTPKRVPLLYSLLKEGDEKGNIHITRGSTYDNAGNLAKNTLEGLTGMYGGTREGNQELMGQMLDAVEGALWTDELLIDAQGKAPQYVPLRIVGVDPSVAENPTDECGIVVVGSSAEPDLYQRQAYVLEDASVHGAPPVWAERVVAMARKWQCPVVAEVNQGGALVSGVIHNIDPSIKVLEVHARNGKLLRAEPVALAYDQNRVTHVNRAHNLDKLETQMTTWMPGETRKSPDRIDALVHGLTALLISPPKGYGGGRVKAKSPAGRAMGLGGKRRPGRGRFSVS